VFLCARESLCVCAYVCVSVHVMGREGERKRRCMCEREIAIQRERVCFGVWVCVCLFVYPVSHAHVRERRCVHVREDGVYVRVRERDITCACLARDMPALKMCVRDTHTSIRRFLYALFLPRACAIGS